MTHNIHEHVHGDCTEHDHAHDHHAHEHEEGHEHHHHHGLHHHHHVHQLTSLNGIFIAAILLNLFYVIVEAVVGFTENSLGLLSDAGHNLSDVFSLLLALIAFKLAKLPPSKKYTYGYRKSTVLISLVNAVILLLAIGAIFIESIHKITEPGSISGSAISITAGIGIIVNGLTAWMLMKSQKNDLNVKGAFLHMVADTLVSVGVVISGFIISWTGWYIIDPIISLFIAAVILISTWKLLTQSLRLTLDGTPENIDVDEIEKTIESDPRVVNAHHIHVWAMSTTENAVTCHMVIRDPAELEDIKDRAKERLAEKGIRHATLEIEIEGHKCKDPVCE